MRTELPVCALGLLLAASGTAMGQVTFYTTRATWVTAVGGQANVAEWRNYAAVLEGASEVVGRPATGADVGSTLTFSDAPVPFKLRCMQPDATFVYRDSGLTGISSLSIGKANSKEDDDLEITFPSGCVRAAGVHLVDNNNESGEQLRVYDTAGNLIGTHSGLAAFLGITSTVPIGRIECDEHPSGDDIATSGIDIVDCTAPAAVRLITNKDDWRLAADKLGTLEGLPSTDFVSTPEAIAEADEVDAPPPTNADLPPTLTFSNFVPEFTLRTLQPGASWVMNDSWSSSLWPLLSIGRVNVHQNDDFELLVTGCTPAVGIVLNDTTAVTDEYLVVLGSGGELMGMLASPASASNADVFVGIIAPSPIARIEFDEDAGGDDIALRGLSFLSATAASPSNLDICQGGSGSLTLAAAIDVSNPKWRKDGVPLTDGPTASGSVVSGAWTATITIDGATLADAGVYDCQTDSECGSTIAVSSNVRICVGDFDCSGFVDTDDFTTFVTEFELGNDSADADRSGFVDTDDFTYFVLAFETGC